ncbi:hypothetical protein AAF712_013651 [Marasmius tenuissimus]|uniref:AAA-ATPase-like domain-containing protein n=1 Tax=Marasmius tenuissimus TaxID=585030 RepID=A0ABR2ZEB3_9AGAR
MSPNESDLLDNESPDSSFNPLSNLSPSQPSTTSSKYLGMSTSSNSVPELSRHVQGLRLSSPCSRLTVTPRDTDVKREDCHEVPDGIEPSVPSLTEQILVQFSETVADFKKLVRFRHYFDRSRIVDILSQHRIVLLHSPPGCGKTSTLSMIGQLYDIFRKDEFEDAFRTTDIGSRAILKRGEPLEHNNQLILSLDLDTVSPSNFSQVLNEQLEKFVTKYKPLINPRDTWSFTCNEATDTVNNIMAAVMDSRHSVVVTIDNYDSPFILLGMPKLAYDKLTRDLVVFLRLLQLWIDADVISTILIAGEHMLDVQLGCRDLAYDFVARNVLDNLDDPKEMKLCGMIRRKFEVSLST